MKILRPITLSKKERISFSPDCFVEDSETSDISLDNSKIRLIKRYGLVGEKLLGEIIALELPDLTPKGIIGFYILGLVGEVGPAARDLMVDDGYRSRGLGTALLSNAVGYMKTVCQTEGISLSRLEAMTGPENYSAQRCLEKVGFIRDTSRMNNNFDYVLEVNLAQEL